MGCILLMAVGMSGPVYVILIRPLMGTTLCHRATSPCTLYSIIVFLGFPCGSAGKESACNVGDLGSIPGLGRFPWRRGWLPTPIFLGFPCGSAGKESACNVGDLGLIPELGRSPGEGDLQYSGLENSMDCIVQGSQRVGHD